jgi:hypothetical protein
MLRVSCTSGMRACQRLGGEGNMHGGKGGDEMVFCRANGSLGGVGAVLVGRNMLKRNSLEDEEGREL